MNKPTIRKGVASSYAGPNESIYDFGDATSGGLISIRRTDNGLIVELYRMDDDVIVRHSGRCASFPPVTP